MVDELFLKAFERLSERVAVLEAAVLPELNSSQVGFVATPAPSPVVPEPDTDAVLTLAAIIRETDGSNRLGAAALAEAILRHPAAAGVFFPSLEHCSVVAGLPDTSHLVPPPWPELPEASPEWPDGEFSADYRLGRRLGWRQARITLAAMNPNRLQGVDNDG